jgi:catechol 2,3-dioxygenase
MADNVREGQRAMIDPSTTLGHVHITVGDLEGQAHFYQDVLGFEVLEEGGPELRLGVAGRELVRLSEHHGAVRERGRTGLYHFAPKVPVRADLGRLLARLLERRVPLQGMVDHHTHEAIYLSDPEGNGIELCWDRPREEWPSWETLFSRGNAPLDAEGLLREAASAVSVGGSAAGEEDGSPPRLSRGTAVGHVHLHVADLEESDRFYVGVLGLEKKAEIPGQAHFTSAGGYHHHVAYNIWAGRGASPPTPGSAGLQHVTLRLPDEKQRDEVIARAAAVGLRPDQTEEGPLLRDPASNGVLLTVGSD